MNNAALAVTIRQLRTEYNRDRFTQVCHDYVHTCGLPVEGSHDRSWNDCYDFLVKYLPTEDEYQNFHLIFEFLMPESLKRADVILLTHNKVVSLEFKEKYRVKKDDLAQAAGYGQSISHYHYLTGEKNMKVLRYLVYTPGDPKGNHDFVDILCPENFTQTIKDILDSEVPMSDEQCEDWIESPFQPLKNMADATLQLFRDGDLPNIKSIREGEIQKTLDRINNVIDDQNISKSIIFVSGVPGAGKTLVGLKTVYDHGRPGEKWNPVYLSGNDPLVNILQNTLSTNHVDLEGSSYIQEMKVFKGKYGSSNATTPHNDIIVFDEAQRAWDMDRREPDQTEATILLRIGDRIAREHGKVTIVCLIGDGQAIHVHEETGMCIWASALAGRNDWNVYIPERYDDLFNSSPCCNPLPELTLDTSIRNDFIDVSPWVEAIIDLDFDKAKNLYQEMLGKGFKCWYCRDRVKLPKIVEFVNENYPDSHTGIVVSSHGRATPFGERYKGSYVKAKEAYNWYVNEGPHLTRGSSEFLIQGTELEYLIVTFVGDYYIQNGKWILDPKATFNAAIQDREKIIKNVYRVLLTRSRKGMFLYFPHDPKLDETFQWFANMLQL